ncbi:hypothetical protein GCM10028803_35140 [Larkinella knui]
MSFVSRQRHLNSISHRPDEPHTLPTGLAALLTRQTLTNMNIIFFMIGISLLLALGFFGAFLWSMKTGQQDDLYTPSMRMLLDDEPTTPSIDTSPLPK